MIKDDLLKLKEAVANRIKRYWPTQTKKAPFPADYPCFYCSYNEGNKEWEFACKYCIHNPEAIIWDLTDATND